MHESNRCPIPKCYNQVWVSRGLPICGEHARAVAFTLTGPPPIQGDEVRRLRTVIATQQRRIDELTNPAPVAQEPAPKPTHGTIYYLQVGNHIKIGWTLDMSRRMRKYPPNSTLLAQHPGTVKDEHKMHRRFATDRTHGREWYVPSVSLTHHIAQVIREHGTPEAVTFGAKPVEIPMPHRLVSEKMMAKLPSRQVS